MNKSDLTNDLKRFTGSSFTSRKQLAEWMGRKDQHSVDRYLVGLERIDGMYFIQDVVESIVGMVTVR